jgi:hypothetical protein
MYVDNGIQMLQHFNYRNKCVFCFVHEASVFIYGSGDRSGDVKSSSSGLFTLYSINGGVVRADTETIGLYHHAHPLNR